MDYIPKEEDFCGIENGYCFEVQLYRENDFLDFFKFNLTGDSFNNLEEVEKTKDDHEIVLKEVNKKLRLEISPKNTTSIEQTVFQIAVKNSTLGYSEGFNNFFREVNKNLTVTKSQFSG